MCDRILLPGGLAALALGLFGLVLGSSGAGPTLTFAVPQPGSTAPAATLSQVGADGIREFRLEAVETAHELRPGLRVLAWGFNGQVPGPEIRVREGERVRIVFTNRLPVEMAIHWHGLHVPNAMDGVPHVAQPPVKPGESFVYEFEAKPAGTHIYHVHSHGDGARQLDMGLIGPFIVESANPESYDREYTLMLDGWAVRGARPAPAWRR